MLKYKKIYIESLKRVSGTPSNFVVELPETVQLDNNTKCQNTRDNSTTFMVWHINKL